MSTCTRFFEGLRDELSPMQLRALPRMKGLAGRCGYTAQNGRGGVRRCHPKRSAANSRFRARVAFYSAFAGPRSSYEEYLRALHARPQYDEAQSKPTGLWEYTNANGITTVGPWKLVAPPGYLIWHVHGTPWLIPVTRGDQRRAIEMMRERRARRAQHR
jgi:hypothetical protein